MRSNIFKDSGDQVVVIFGGQDSIYIKFKIGKTNLIRIVFGLGETYGGTLRGQECFISWSGCWLHTGVFICENHCPVYLRALL